MNTDLTVKEVKEKLFAAQRQINALLMGLYGEVGIVDIETLVRYPEHSTYEHAKQPIVLLTLKVDVN